MQGSAMSDYQVLTRRETHDRFDHVGRAQDNNVRFASNTIQSSEQLIGSTNAVGTLSVSRRMLTGSSNAFNLVNEHADQDCFILGHGENLSEHVRHEFTTLAVELAQEILRIDFKQLAALECSGKSNEQLVTECTTEIELVKIEMIMAASYQSVDLPHPGGP
jgi:hypothetical protein